MKKWRMIVCVFCTVWLLTACGSSENDIQSVEPEDIADVSVPVEEETEVPEEAELPQKAEEEEIEEGETSEKTPAVVNIETEEQEYKEGELLLMTVDYDKVSVAIEGNEEAANLITEWFTKNEKAFQENVAETLEWAKENQDMIEHTASYYQTHGFAVTRNDGRVLSFSSNTGGYDGGAHGYYMEYGANFDVATGQFLSIADVAADEDAFQEICVQEMLRQCEDLKAEGILFDEEIIVPSLKEVLEGKMEGEEWYFMEEGIRFISNIYEIAPYAAGEITFDIPYEMVNETLKAEYKG